MNELDITVQIDEEKREKLYHDQVKLLKTFLSHGAITQQQYDKSYYDLTAKWVWKAQARNEHYLSPSS